MPKPNQDRPIVDAAKLIVSSAIVVPVAIAAVVVILAITVAIVQGATSSIGAFVAVCAGIAYAVRRDKHKQALFVAQRSASVIEQEREPAITSSHQARMARFAELGADEYERQRRAELHLPPDQ